MAEDRKTDRKERQVVVSVRFPGQLLERIHAVAAVQGVTANTVIRDGMDAHLTALVASSEFQEASKAFLARAQAQVATAIGESQSGGGRVHA